MAAHPFIKTPSPVQETLRPWPWHPPTRLVAPLLLLAITVNLNGCDIVTSSSFDTAQWEAAKNDPPTRNRRARQVSALMKTLRAGMPRSEVLQLLGPPDQQRTSSDLYELGVAPLGIDDEWFKVQYDEQGLVVQFGQTRG